MKFVIQHNLMNEEQLLLTKAAVEQYPHVYVGLIPFSREITSDEPLEGQDFIPYGSTLFTSLTKDLGWKGIHFDLATFNYEAACNNRSDMLNGYCFYRETPAILTIGQLFEVLMPFPSDKEWFIRPSEDLKQFSGQIMTTKEILTFLNDAITCESSGSCQLSINTKVVCNPPSNIQAEWRWFIIGGKIIDGSMYRANGQLIKKHETDADVIAEAQTFADKWLPAACCVMDLALVDNELKVIEFNCLNSSGFYNHDVAAIFDALYNYHIQEGELQWYF